MCVTILKNEGVKVTLFESHLTRSASIAHCKREGISVKKINKAARWSSSETFEKHYNKPIVEEIESFPRSVFGVV